MPNTMNTKRMRRLGSTLPGLAANFHKYGVWGVGSIKERTTNPTSFDDDLRPRLVPKSESPRVWKF